MATLKNRTGGVSKTGFLAKAIRGGGFDYAGVGDVPIGVVAEAVKRDAPCEINTGGSAKVYVDKWVGADEPIRSIVASDLARSGSAVPIGTENAYTIIGRTTESGKGLVNVLINITPVIASPGGAGGVAAGGTAGQVYTKNTATNYDAGWATLGYATTSWVNTNFDNYTSWNYEYDTVSPQSVAITSGSSFGLVPGTDIGFSWDGANRRQTINYTGSPGTMDDWYLNVETGADHIIQNHTQLDFKAGTTGYINVAYDFTAPRHEVIIDINTTPFNADYYTRTLADSTFTTEAWVNTNFDNYTSWNYEYDTVTPQVKAIATGDSFGIIGGTNIGTSWDGVNNRLTINYSGSASYTGWDLYTEGISRGTIANLENVDFIGGTGVTIVYNFNSGTATNEITFNATGVAPAYGSTTQIPYMNAGGTAFIYSANLVFNGTSLTVPDLNVTESSDSNNNMIYLSNVNIGTSAATSIFLSAYGNNAALVAYGDNHTIGANHTRLQSTAGGANIGIGSSTELGFLWTVNADVKLYYDNSVKLTTASTGIAVTGAITATGNLTSYASDGRLKTNVNPIKDPLGILRGTNGVTFDWRDGVEDLGFTPLRKSETGFIAQNLGASMEEAIAPAPFDLDAFGKSISGMDYMTTRPEKLIPVITEAIKILEDRLIVIENKQAKD